MSADQEHHKPQPEANKTATSGRGKLVLLIGPSGVGKSVILGKLRNDHKDLHFPRSATTRAKREREGDEIYHFVNEEQFDELLRNDKLLEWAVVHGIGRYGTLVDEIIPFIREGKIVVREVDVQGFESIRKHVLFQGNKSPYQLQSIFLLPENEQQLLAHINKRSKMSEEELQKRMESMKNELSYAKLCDHQVVNKEGRLKDAYGEIERLIYH
jgi:guanylate kinase